MSISLSISVTDAVARNILLSWSDTNFNPDPPTNYQIYFNMDGGGWTLWKDTGYSVEYEYDYGLTQGITWGYYVYNADSLESSNADYVYFGINYSDTISNTVTVSSSLDADTLTAVDSISNTVNVSSLTVTVLDAVDTATNTITVSSVERSSQSVSDTYSWYVADDAGNVYTYSPTLYSDNGDNINSSWHTKTLDFSELGYENAMKWKTVYGARVIYKDIDSSVPFSFAYSIDGGTTWTGSTKSAGTASNKTAGKSFFFVETGQYFDMKIDVISTTKIFQIIGIEVDVDPEGPQVEMS